MVTIVASPHPVCRRNGSDTSEGTAEGKIDGMMTTRRLVATVVAMTVLIALLCQMVIMQRGYVHEVYVLPQSDGRTWFEWFDWYSIRLARRLVEDKTFFEITALLGLRGLILSVCVPILALVAWRRRTWAPIVGFVIVLLFETGLAGSMKVAMGRQFPWESWPRVGRSVDPGQRFLVVDSNALADRLGCRYCIRRDRISHGDCVVQRGRT